MGGFSDVTFQDIENFKEQIQLKLGDDYEVNVNTEVLSLFGIKKEIFDIVIFYNKKPIVAIDCKSKFYNKKLTPI